MKNSSYQIHGSATLDISQVNSSLGKIQQNLSKIQLKPELKNSFTKVFSDIQSEVAKFQQQIGKGFKTKGDVSGLESTARKIDSLFTQLGRNISEVQKMDFSKVIKFDSNTTKQLSTIDIQIKQLQKDLQSISAEHIDTVTSSLAKLQNEGAKKGGTRILEAFKAGDFRQAKQELDNLIASQQKWIAQSESAGKNTSRLQSNLSILTNLVPVFEQATRASEGLENNINQLDASKINILESAVSNLAKGFNESSDAVSETQQVVRETSQEVASFANNQQRLNAELDQVKNNITHFFSLANSIQLLQKTIRSAFETVKELDKAMTETAVVTDFSVGDMWEELPRYTAAANELGTTTLGAYETMTLFYQQGLKTNEVFEIGMETMKMARIAGMDYVQATDLMTAALRGFNMELNNDSALKVNDVYSELAAITASDTEEIATAMTKTASIANSANMEFETTAAFLAQMIETTRESAENLGTAMKTIVARFTEMKKAPTGIAEVEGEEVNVNKVDEALKSVGVSLKDVNGEFRALDDVFLELASKWNTLDIMQQRYVATTAAGSRQQSRFIAMMSNYERTMELVNAANNSAGASQRQFEKTTESLESKLNRLSNAWNEFTMGIANNSMIKGAVDILTSILETINQITKSLGPTAGGILKLGLAFASIKIGKSVFDKVFNVIGSSFLKGGQDAGEKFDSGLRKNLEKATLSTRSWAKTINNQLRQNFQEEGNTFSSIARSFSKVPTEIQQEIHSKFPSIGQSLIEDFKEGINYDSLTKEGQDKAKEFIDGFKQTIEQGNTTLAVNTLSYQATGKDFDWSKSNGNNIQQLKASDNTVKTLTNSMTKLGSTVGSVGSAFNDFASVLDGLGLTGLANGIRAVGSAFTAVGGIITTVMGMIHTIGGVTTAVLAGVIAVAGVLIGLAVNAYNNSLDGRLEAAKKTTQEAKKVADQAKESYEKLLSDKAEYDTLQGRLDELIEGTQEWTNALLEANEQVLELLRNYPKLAQYVQTGKYNQIELSEEGQKEYVEAVKEGLTNAANYSLASQIDEMSLELEKSQSSLYKKVQGKRVVDPRTQGFVSGSTSLPKEITDELFRIYKNNPAELTLENVNKKIIEMGSAGTMTAEQLESSLKAFSDYEIALNKNNTQVQGITRALLLNSSDTKLLESEYKDNLITVFSNALSGNFNEKVQQRADDIYQFDMETDQQIVERLEKRGLSDENDDLKNLEKLYADMMQIDISDIGEDLKGHSDKLALAISKMELVSETIDNMSELYQKINDKNKDSIQEFLGIMSQDETAISEKDISNIQKQLEKNDFETEDEWVNRVTRRGSVISDYASEFGLSVSELASELGVSIDELAHNFSNSINIMKEAQIETRKSLATKMFTSGAFDNSQEVAATINKLTDPQRVFLDGLTDTIQTQLGSQGTANFLTGMSDIYLNETEEVIKEAEKIFGNISWDNPIEAFSSLDKATKNANSSIQALGASMLIAGRSSYSAAGQFRYFAKSAEFSEISDDIEDLIKENGQLSGKNIKEMAASSGTLKKMLDQTNTSATTAAKVFSSLSIGKIKIDDITDSLLVAISSFNRLDEVIDESIDLMNNFDPGIDEGSVGEWVDGIREKVTELYENGEYGNSQLQNYLKMLFGEDEWNAAMREFGGNLEKVEGKFVSRMGVLSENLYGAWRDLALNYQDGLAEFNAKNGTNIAVQQLEDGSIDLITNGATTDQVVKTLADAYHISEDYAKMMLTDFKNFSGDLQTELAANDWSAGIGEYVESRTLKVGTGYETEQLGRGPKRQVEVEETKAVFSDKEVENISAITGKDTLTIWKDIASAMGIATDELKNVEQVQDAIGQKGLVLKLLDEQGNLKSINDISKELDSKLGSGSSWVSAFSNGGKIALEDLQNGLSNLNIDPSSIKELVMKAVEESGPETTFTIGGIEVSAQEILDAGGDINKLLEEKTKEIDMTNLGEAIAKAIYGLDIDFSEVEDKTNTSFKTVYDTIKGYMDDANTAINSINTSTDTAGTSVGNLGDKINNLQGKTVPITVDINKNKSGVKIGDAYLSFDLFENGAYGLPRNQLGILGDGNGPELVIGQDGQAKVVGIGGPELTSLKKGDTIYTAEETEDILGGRHPKKIDAFANAYKRPSSQTYGGGSGSSNSSGGGNQSVASDVGEEVEEWENTYDWLYNLTEDINEELRTREKLERRYNRILIDRTKTGKDLLANVNAQLDSLKQQQKLEQEMYEKRTSEMQRTLDDNRELAKYATFNWKDNTIEINWDLIDSVTDKDTGEAIEKYISKLEDIQDEMDNAEDALDDIIDEIQELKDLGKDEFFDLENRIMDALVGKYQEQIDELSAINDSMDEANSKLIDSIQKNLSKLRQDRDNEKTEEDLAAKERRLAYLRQDTSGGNALEIKKLEEELANAQEDYTDSLIDQKISELQDQNDKASQQRQKQVELAQAQLEWAQKTGELWSQVQTLVKDGVDKTGKLVEKSDLAALLKSQEGFEGLSNLQKMNWMSELEQDMKVAVMYYNKMLNEHYGTSYNPKNDYMADIDAAINKGDLHAAAVAEQKRNAKIVNENLDYELTYNYVDYLDKYQGNVDYMAEIDKALKNNDYLSAAIAELQRNKKIDDLGLDYEKTYDYIKYLFIKGSNPLLDYTRASNVQTYSSMPSAVSSNVSRGFDGVTDIARTFTSDNLTQNSGDNYYEIHIEVDSLGSDYDVDKLTDKIKRSIQSDAQYRNVNAISHLK